jgi:hypothetical protein
MRSLVKNLSIFVGSCIVFAGLLEIGSTAIYRVYRGVPFDRAELRRRLNADRFETGIEVDAGAGDAAIADQPVILHPYFGFVINPEKSGINEHGFFRASPLTKRSPGKVVIAFFGGSVADQVFYMAGDTLVDELRDRPGYAGKEIELITTAVGGYKQPQQMIVLATLMALGAEFDVVINLDGFNEIDTAHDNVVEGVNPYFPHAWKLQARQGFDAETARRMGRIELIREERWRLKVLFARPALQHSAFFLSLWDFLDGGREADLRREMAELDRALAADTLPPQIRGPRVEFPDMESFFAEMTDFWARSSLSMSRLSAAGDTVYAHFLQPNQYVPGSKVLTEKERAVAIDPSFAGKERVPQAYPLLIEKGEELRRKGVRFTDLTMIYADEPRTIYNDFCCHVNELGAEIMARHIAAALPDLD